MTRSLVAARALPHFLQWGITHTHGGIICIYTVYIQCIIRTHTHGGIIHRHTGALFLAMGYCTVYNIRRHTGALCNQGGKWEYQWALASANAAEVQQQQQLQQRSKELKKSEHYTIS